MTTQFGLLDEHGCLTETWNELDEPASTGLVVAVPLGINPFQHRFVDGAWIERPLAPAPVRSGNVWTIHQAPAGMTVTVSDVLGGVLLTDPPLEATAEIIAFSMPMSGVYVICCDAPAPYRNWDPVRVEVSDAD